MNMLNAVRRRPLASAAVTLLVALIAAALLAGVVAPYDPLAQDPPHRLQGPSWSYPFGTDTFGRDVFSRVLYGARSSLYIAFAAAAIAGSVGLLLGLASGYLAGTFDLLLQRLVDALLSFPPLLIGLLVVVALGHSATSIMLALALALAPQTVRLARSRVLALKQERHVAAARVLGAGGPRIVLCHILPHLTSPLLAQVTTFVGIALVAEASLSYLGLGVPPPAPAWGRMIHEGSRQFLEAAPWLTIFPGLAMAATLLSVTILGDTLRDLLDPHLQDA